MKNLLPKPRKNGQKLSRSKIASKNISFFANLRKITKTIVIYLKLLLFFISFSFIQLRKSISFCCCCFLHRCESISSLFSSILFVFVPLEHLQYLNNIIIFIVDVNKSLFWFIVIVNFFILLYITPQVINRNRN